MTNLTMPNFFIVGAAKAGTTSLYEYLSHHPEVYFSNIKEPHFFDTDTIDHDMEYETDYIDFESALKKKLHSLRVKDTQHYHQLFNNVTTQKAIGEATVSYLYSKISADSIHETVPEAKIIIILRNPVERAFSHYLMDVRSQWTNKPFLNAAIDSLNDAEEDWACQYIRLGLYHEQVKRYFDIFPKSQIKVLLFDNLKTDTNSVIQDIFEFLEIQPDIACIDHNKKYNKAQLPKYTWVNGLFRGINAMKKVGIFIKIMNMIPEKITKRLKSLLMSSDTLPRLSSNDREALLPYFSDDIKKLSTLINRDLSHWLK